MHKLTIRIVAIGACTVLALAVAIGATAASPKPGPNTIAVTPDQAISAVGRFTSASGLTVSPTTIGRFRPLFVVEGPDVSATVDATTGAIASIVLNSRVPVTSVVTITAATAQNAAAAYLAANGIPTTDLSPTVALADHGGMRQFDVTWQRRVNGALVPDQRIVSVNPQTGEVFSLIDIAYPFTTPSVPLVSQAAAVAAAQSLVDAPSAALDSVDLVVSFDTSGAQTLVWRVGLRIGGIPPSAAMVEVDALTGAATVIGRG
jgi:hypothetical protein